MSARGTTAACARDFPGRTTRCNSAAVPPRPSRSAHRARGPVAWPRYETATRPPQRASVHSEDRIATCRASCVPRAARFNGDEHAVDRRIGTGRQLAALPVGNAESGRRAAAPASTAAEEGRSGRRARESGRHAADSRRRLARHRSVETDERRDQVRDVADPEHGRAIYGAAARHHRRERQDESGAEGDPGCADEVRQRIAGAARRAERAASGQSRSGIDGRRSQDRAGRLREGAHGGRHRAARAERDDRRRLHDPVRRAGQGRYAGRHEVRRFRQGDGPGRRAARGRPEVQRAAGRVPRSSERSEVGAATARLQEPAADPALQRLADGQREGGRRRVEILCGRHELEPRVCAVPVLSRRSRLQGRARCGCRPAQRRAAVAGSAGHDAGRAGFAGRRAAGRHGGREGRELRERRVRRGERQPDARERTAAIRQRDRPRRTDGHRDFGVGREDRARARADGREHERRLSADAVRAATGRHAAGRLYEEAGCVQRVAQEQSARDDQGPAGRPRPRRRLREALSGAAAGGHRARRLRRRIRRKPRAAVRRSGLADQVASERAIVVHEADAAVAAADAVAVDRERAARRADVVAVDSVARRERHAVAIGVAAARPSVPAAAVHRHAGRADRADDARREAHPGRRGRDPRSRRAAVEPSQRACDQCGTRPGPRPADAGKKHAGVGAERLRRLGSRESAADALSRRRGRRHDSGAVDAAAESEAGAARKGEGGRHRGEQHGAASAAVERDVASAGADGRIRRGPRRASALRGARLRRGERLQEGTARFLRSASRRTVELAARRREREHQQRRRDTVRHADRKRAAQSDRRRARHTARRSERCIVGRRFGSRIADEGRRRALHRQGEAVDDRQGARQAAVDRRRRKHAGERAADGLCVQTGRHDDERDLQGHRQGRHAIRRRDGEHLPRHQRLYRQQRAVVGRHGRYRDRPQRGRHAAARIEGRASRKRLRQLSQYADEHRPEHRHDDRRDGARRSRHAARRHRRRRDRRRAAEHSRRDDDVHGDRRDDDERRARSGEPRRTRPQPQPVYRRRRTRGFRQSGADGRRRRREARRQQAVYARGDRAHAHAEGRLGAGDGREGYRGRDRRRRRRGGVRRGRRRLLERQHEASRRGTEVGPHQRRADGRRRPQGARGHDRRQSHGQAVRRAHDQRQDGHGRRPDDRTPAEQGRRRVAGGRPQSRDVRRRARDGLGRRHADGRRQGTDLRRQADPRARPRVAQSVAAGRIRGARRGRQAVGRIGFRQELDQRHAHRLADRHGRTPVVRPRRRHEHHAEGRRENAARPARQHVAAGPRRVRRRARRRARDARARAHGRAGRNGERRHQRAQRATHERGARTGRPAA
ncbi:hypothetical protein FEP76_05677 [Burkholderia multivorans]|nr:hypothetical protein [Burkholderia multivorans]